jgi:hypothetical protein
MTRCRVFSRKGIKNYRRKNMKKSLIQTCAVLMFACFPLFSLISLPQSHAPHWFRDFKPCEKTYVTHQQISVGNRAILIKIDDEWFLTEHLYSDGKGLYVLNLSPEAYPCATLNMPCPNCEHCIYQDLTTCLYCGKSTQR